jgi:hypothetical protein
MLTGLNGRTDEKWLQWIISHHMNL